MSESEQKIPDVVYESFDWEEHPADYLGYCFCKKCREEVESKKRRGAEP